jgi:putative SOS response-associated peptidase YedK
MCGRYSIKTDEDQLCLRFKAGSSKESLKPRYNSAPSQNLPVIPNESPKKIALYRWGLIPHWAKDEKIGYKMINARAETLLEKSTFKLSLKKQRCLVLADGFYEWKKEGSFKTPYRILLKSEEPFAFAGLWASWYDSKGKETRSFTIITIEPNSLISKIHNRMPAILLPENEEIWLDPDVSEEKALKLLKPYPAKLMQAYPVSKLVNSPKNDIPEILQPAEKETKTKKSK